MASRPRPTSFPALLRTAALNAGVPLRGGPLAARHATPHHHRDQNSGRHACAVVAFVNSG